MKPSFLLGFFVAAAILPQRTLAYPPVEFQACIKNAMNSVVQKGLPATYKQVEAYCDCSLTKIIDEGKDINTSLVACNAAHF